MQDAIPGTVRKNAVEQGQIGEVAVNEAHLRRYRRAMAGTQAVEDDDFVTGVQQGENDVTADIAGAACNQKAGRGHRCRFLHWRR
ncbi:hypothetical protein AA23498_0817 [Acetobacter nitrogenifigens DSM 23921 = NBRC 105050]|nr:hypothetical protein AA23498_0817 [Acetobacter nitrogenifigens DSM 23921 = NBRC 105050]